MPERPRHSESLVRLAGIATIPVLFVVFALGSVVAAAQKKEPDLEEGARLVEARCVFCHGKESLPKLVERCAAEHGEAFLDEFLKRHHAPDDEARTNIIAFLTCPPSQ